MRHWERGQLIRNDELEKLVICSVLEPERVEDYQGCVILALLEILNVPLWTSCPGYSTYYRKQQTKNFNKMSPPGSRTTNSIQKLIG